MPERPPYAARAVGLVVAAQAALLLAVSGGYGPHRDELYFASAGRHLAWGYPDQPSFTPLLARLADLVAPGNLVVLRLPSIVAVVGIVLLAVEAARVLGGGRTAQLLTALSLSGSALLMALGHRLTTATFDTLAWTAVLVVVLHAVAVADDRPRLWLLAGLVAGVGLENKHSVAFVLGGVLAGVALTPVARPVLRTPWPWLGGVLALVLWLPNLVWQAAHDWPVLALSGDIADEYGGLGGRLGLVAQALVMYSPLVAVVWIVGLVALLRRAAWGAARPLAWAFLAVTVVFLVTGGKGYYLAGAIPPLVAAGSVVLAERWPARRAAVAGALLAVSGMVAWPAMAPWLPVRTYAGSFYTAIDQDQLETIGWPAYAGTVREVVAALPEGGHPVVLTGNYGEAGAFEWYGVGAPVFSGHNGWQDWGPPPADAGPVVVVGWADPEADFTGCRRTATLSNSVGADNEEQGMPVWVCDGPVGTWAEAWPGLSHLDA